MKTIITILILTIASAALYADTDTKYTYPNIIYEYGSIFDLMCPQNPNYPLKNEMKMEVINAIPELQKEWDRTGTKLVSFVTQYLKTGFKRKELSATLLLCHTVIPMSSPFLLNYRMFLKSSPHTLSINYFIATTFHELLHRYLVANFQDGLLKTSKLLWKYRNEGFSVLSHLHLYALMKRTYTELGLRNVLEEIIRTDSTQIPDPGYKRAWNIIMAPAGEIPFLEELKAITKE